MSNKEYKAKLYKGKWKESMSNAITKVMKERPDLRKAISDNMKENNPMKSEDIRNKVSLKLKEEHALGTKTPRGGNGHPPTYTESMILERFSGLTWNYAVSLGKRQDGYPTNYKVDLAFIDRQIGIEIDGHSHNVLKRQAQDHKKEEKLKELGWTIIRFTNQQVLESFEEVVACIQSLLQEK
jgi:hypothetical protein